MSKEQNEGRELRSIVMDGPMPPADDCIAEVAQLPAIGIMPGVGVMGTPTGIGTSISGDASLGDLLREQDSFNLPEGRPDTDLRQLSAGSQWMQRQLQNEYDAIDRVVGIMRSVGLTNQTIMGVLNGTPGAIDMARTSVRLQAPAQNVLLRDAYLDASEAIHAVAGSPAARVYLRQHIRVLSRSQSYEEIVAAQEQRREAQQREFQQSMSDAQTQGRVMPSDETMERYLERHNRTHGVPVPAEAQSRGMLTDVLLNNQQLADIRRWGRDELGADTMRHLMGVSHIVTDHNAHSDAQHNMLQEQIRREVDLLYDWLWGRTMVRTGQPRTTRLPYSETTQRIINDAAHDVMQWFNVHCQLNFNSEDISREHMNVTLRLDGPDSYDVHRCLIVGDLTYHPAILMILNGDGRYDFANYGHRAPANAEGSGRPTDRPTDLRGRDGGSSSYPADGDRARPARLLNLDL